MIIALLQLPGGPKVLEFVVGEKNLYGNEEETRGLSLDISLKQDDRQVGLGPALLIVLRRVVAIAFLGFALLYWAKIVAFGSFAGEGITAMAEHQQFASVILAVTMPVAAIGLWGLFAWGTSTWLAVMLFELVYRWNFSDPGISTSFETWFHLTTLGIYIAIKAFMLLTRKRSPHNGQAIN